jgi:hypothetical protein
MPQMNANLRSSAAFAFFSFRFPARLAFGMLLAN